MAAQRVPRNGAVCSVGVRTDIVFDLALIEATGANVFAFDPTPRSLAWIRAQSPPSNFHLLPVGLHVEDSEIEFFAPLDSSNISYSISASGHAVESARLKMKRLETQVKEMRYSRLDVLKMDIEGAEYGVIDEIVVSECQIGQILVELHHSMPGFTVGHTHRAVHALRSAGYRIAAISPIGYELNFLHVDAAGARSEPDAVQARA